MMRTKNTGSSSKTVQLPIKCSNSVAVYTVLRWTELSGFYARSDAIRQRIYEQSAQKVQT